MGEREEGREESWEAGSVGSVGLHPFRAADALLQSVSFLFLPACGGAAALTGSTLRCLTSCCQLLLIISRLPLVDVCDAMRL